MKKHICLYIILFSLATQISGEIFKAAVTADPADYTSMIFDALQERSGITIHKVPLLADEIPNALAEGLVDLAITGEDERLHRAALRQNPVIATPMVLIGEKGTILRERNLNDLKTIAVFAGDEHLLMEHVIDRYSIEARILKVRRYGSLPRTISTARASAIFLPLSKWAGIEHNGELEGFEFSEPFLAGVKESYLFISRARADNVAPHLDKLIKVLEEMKSDGTIDRLRQSRKER